MRTSLTLSVKYEFKTVRIDILATWKLRKAKKCFRQSTGVRLLSKIYFKE